jgi:hypothetical protein
VKQLTLPTIPQTRINLPPLTPRPSKSVNNPEWILCSELSEQYWVILSRVDFPAQKYCSSYSVYTAFIWDNYNKKEIDAIESFKYTPAKENYHSRIQAAIELFIK